MPLEAPTEEPAATEASAVAKPTRRDLLEQGMTMQNVAVAEIISDLEYQVSFNPDRSLAKKVRSIGEVYTFLTSLPAFQANPDTKLDAKGLIEQMENCISDFLPPSN